MNVRVCIMHVLDARILFTVYTVYRVYCLSCILFTVYKDGYRCHGTGTCTGIHSRTHYGTHMGLQDTVMHIRIRIMHTRTTHTHTHSFSLSLSLSLSLSHLLHLPSRGIQISSAALAQRQRQNIENIVLPSEQHGRGERLITIRLVPRIVPFLLHGHHWNPAPPSSGGGPRARGSGGFRI